MHPSDKGLVGEYDASGTEIRTYGYRPDSTWTTDPLWLKENGEYHYYQNDHLGTPQKLVQMNGAIAWSANYTAFGQASVEVETVTNNLRFPGQYFDAETGMHYNRYRYYAPGIGRYLRTDPIGLKGGIHLVTHVHNNPLKHIDPEGLIVGAIAVGGIIAKLGVLCATPIGVVACPAVAAIVTVVTIRLIIEYVVSPCIQEISIWKDSIYFPPKETWENIKREPDDPNKYKGPQPPDCSFWCNMCWDYLNKNVKLSNFNRAAVACFECGRCVAGLWD